MFDRLNKAGLVALQNAGHTQSDGFDEVQVVYDNLPRAKLCTTRGYCFYAGEDLARAVDTGELYLSFGATQDDPEKSWAIGGFVVKVLRAEGFSVQWNGSSESRVLVADFT